MTGLDVTEQTALTDQWFTGLQTAFTSAMTAVAGALGAWGLLRRKYSQDTTEIRKDQGEWQWIQAALAERDRVVLAMEAARVTLTEDARTIARLEARVAFLEDRDMMYEEDRIRHLGACEERVRSLSEQVLDQKLNNARLFMALSKADPEAAESLLLQHLRPVPPNTPGNEPP